MARRARRAIEVYRSKRNAWLAEQLGLEDPAARERLATAVKVMESLTASAGPDPVEQQAEVDASVDVPAVVD